MADPALESTPPASTISAGTPEGARDRPDATRGTAAKRAVDMHRLAFDADLATGIGPVGPRQDFHQGRFAGAVLAHEREDLAGAGGKIHPIERFDARELDGDPAHLQREMPGGGFLIWLRRHLRACGTRS